MDVAADVAAAPIPNNAFRIFSNHGRSFVDQLPTLSKMPFNLPFLCRPPLSQFPLWFPYGYLQVATVEA
jgi:hypothetical protein